MFFLVYIVTPFALMAACGPPCHVLHRFVRKMSFHHVAKSILCVSIEEKLLTFNTKLTLSHSILFNPRPMEKVHTVTYFLLILGHFLSTVLALNQGLVIYHCKYIFIIEFYHRDLYTNAFSHF